MPRSTPRSFPAYASPPRLPKAPRSIEKGRTLRTLLDRDAIDCLVHNISRVHAGFDGAAFRRSALRGLAPLGLMDRGLHLARALREHLPERYEAAVRVLLRSLTPARGDTERSGMEVFFYLPHSAFIAEYGVDPHGNAGRDPFDVSMKAQYEITRRFTAEFSIRPFLDRFPDRTLAVLRRWTRDPCPHVRRLCSEGSRPRLPWGMRLRGFVRDPRPALPILEALKDDPSLYVRRSVANHLGDIAKDHLDLVLQLCERWLDGASNDRRWLIRHALRHPAKKGVSSALRLRARAR